MLLPPASAWNMQTRVIYPNQPSAKRVESLICRLKEADDLRVQIYIRTNAHFGDWLESGRASLSRESDLLPGYAFADSLLEMKNQRFKEVITDIQKLLRRYKWTPTVRAFDYFCLDRVYLWTTRVTVDHWENFAIQWLLGHIQGSGNGPSHSKIAQFRRCRHCARWYYALKDHQLHCSDVCRKKFSANSPAFREKRRLYMREKYRPQQRERERKAIAALKRSRKREA